MSIRTSLDTNFNGKGQVFHSYLSVTNGVGMSERIPLLNSNFLEAKNGFRTSSLFYKISTPQVFCDTQRKTFLVCGSLEVTGAWSGLKWHPYYQTARQFAVIYHLGDKNVRLFSPLCLKQTTSEKKDGRPPKISPSSLGVSPDGNTVLGFVASKNRSELWEWKLDKTRAKRIWSGTWNKACSIPYCAFCWAHNGFYFTPRIGGRLLFFSGSRSPRVILQKAPIFIDFKHRLGFFIHSTSGSNFSISKKEPFDLNICKLSRLKTSTFIVDPALWSGTFGWQNDNEGPIVLPCEDGYFFIKSSLQNSVIENPRKNLTIPVPSDVREVFGNTAFKSDEFDGSTDIEKYNLVTLFYYLISHNKLLFQRGFSNTFFHPETASDLNYGRSRQYSVFNSKTNEQLIFGSSRNLPISFYGNFTEKNKKTFPLNVYPCSSNGCSRFPMNESS